MSIEGGFVKLITIAFEKKFFQLLDSVLLSPKPKAHEGGKFDLSIFQIYRACIDLQLVVNRWGKGYAL